MAAFVEARESARTAQKTLYYIQAVDICTNPLSTEVNKEKLYQSFLQVSSLTQTKRLPAFCLLHIGMEVRLTTTIEVPYAVQDATGTVISIEFDHSDAAVHEHNLKDPVLQNLKPEILLQKLPTALPMCLRCY